MNRREDSPRKYYIVELEKPIKAIYDYLLFDIVVICIGIYMVLYNIFGMGIILKNFNLKIDL